MDFNIFEEQIREQWKKDSLQTKLKNNREDLNGPRWQFLDGPPFVNGSPHHGHILVSTIKDTMARFMFQKGFKISYQIGFDCHGLPLEQEAEKRVGKVSPNDPIEKIKVFNDTCRDIIKNCSEVWYDVLGQLGRQFDKKETYYTSDFNYMQNLWNSFKILWDKNLIYQSKKVMPYSPLCETPLSNFEANQNYKERTDLSIYVRFKVKNSSFDKNEYLVIWTTTPWSLYANQGICVNPNIVYVLLESKNDYYWIASSAVQNLFELSQINFIKTALGSELNGLEYEPIFNYSKCIYRVYTDNYVTEGNSSGTGLVHLAPLFGEDDLRVMKQNGYTIDLLPSIVDSQVRFTIDDTNILNKFVMDTSLDVTIDLKKNGYCMKSEKVKHNYPYCWRTDHPLVYLATDAWFLKVKSIIPAILENNSKIKWYPEYVGTERFANWIRSAPDWCLSRNRIWGTPIPIWCSSSGKQICISDISELEKLTGVKITDLHLDHLKDLSFVIDDETYNRTFGVLDCWFESGLATTARNNMKDFKPVDFIAESLDQTRGWFYTLNVLSTALYNKPAYNSVIVSGLILAEDGKKMSKRLKNYTNPIDLINRYGSDVLRLYLLSSGSTKAESSCFKDKELADISRKLGPYANAIQLFKESMKIYNEPIQNTFESTNKLDIWIYHIFHQLRNRIYEHLEKLELTPIPNLIYKFIDQLCNTYVKLSRDRLKSQCSLLDTQQSLSTLYYILDQSNTLFVPFMPHLAEYFHKELNPEETSIHFRLINTTNKIKTNSKIIQSIYSLNELFETTRTLRNKINRPNIYPLDILEIYTGATGLLEFKEVIKKELNVKEIIVHDYTNLPFIYKVNRLELGKDFKQRSKEMIQRIESGNIDFPECKPTYYSLEYIAKPKENYIESKFDYYIDGVKNTCVIYLSNQVTLENIQEAHLNYIRRQINLLKKSMGIKISDKSIVFLEKNNLFNNIAVKSFSKDVHIVDYLETDKEITTLNNEYGTIRIKIEVLL